MPAVEAMALPHTGGEGRAEPKCIYHLGSGARSYQEAWDVRVSQVIPGQLEGERISCE